MQILPQNDIWGDIAQSVGQGAAEGYVKAHDDKAIQSAIEKLGPNPQAKDLLHAVLGAKTYSNASKKQAFEQYADVEKLEEAHHKAEEDRKARLDIANQKAEQDKLKAAETVRHNKAGEQSVTIRNNLLNKKTEQDLELAKLRNEITRKGFDLKEKESNLRQLKTKADQDIANKELELKVKKLESDIEKNKNDLDIRRKELAVKETQFEKGLGFKEKELGAKGTQFEKEFQLKEADQKLREVKSILDNQKYINERQVEEQKKLATKAMVDRMPGWSAEQKKELGNTLDYDDAVKMFTEAQKPKDVKLSPVDQYLQKKEIDKYIDAMEALPKLKDNRANLDAIDQMIDDLDTVSYVAGWFNLSKEAAQLENMAYAAIEPVIKIFNPAGPLGQQKLKNLQAQYHVKATDFEAIKKAKIATLRIFNDQAINRSEEKLRIYDKYKGHPPQEVIAQMDIEDSMMLDTMLDVDIAAEAARYETLPPKLKGVNPADYQGETLTDNATGINYYSDGARWQAK